MSKENKTIEDYPELIEFFDDNSMLQVTDMGIISTISSRKAIGKALEMQQEIDKLKQTKEQTLNEYAEYCMSVGVENFAGQTKTAVRDYLKIGN